ncbi:MAG: hypothetical protein GX130_13035 [Candidatus Hydrogenedens sp.]|jgi:hypothetical protein|nr:hypothetical protein [Candidatus Hydrogenedens sp.]
MKGMIHVLMKNWCPSLVLLLFACIITSDAFSLNAPVTPEMLLSLRARQGMDVSKDPLNVSPVMDEGQIVPTTRKENKATFDSAAYFLMRAFDIDISFEIAVDLEFSNEKRSFYYSVGINERLFDALEKLVEASEGYIRWRLLDGRIVLTAMPDDDRITAGDRILQVDIDAATMGEALSQLERAYNEQYTDVPFIFDTRDHKFFHSNTAAGDRFRVQGQNTLRDIIISLLNQWNPIKAYYRLFAKHPVVHKTIVRQYYNDNNLYCYSLDITDMEALMETEKQFKQGFLDEGFEERHLWAGAQFPEMSRRLMGYFDRIHPQWAAEEDAAATESAQEEQP